MTGRGLVLAAVCAVVGAGAVQTAAHADSAPPVPTSLRTSPAPTGGASDDGCGADEPYGSIGLGSVTFDATSTTTGGSLVRTEFSVTPGDGSPGYDYTSGDLASGTQTGVTLPSDDFTDGVTYTWQARALTDSGAASDWSAPCHFVTDHTPPPVPVLTSTDFPSSASGLPAPVARTTGTVHLAVSGPGASDVVAARYALDTAISVLGGPSVPVGADSTADITITPTSWGYHTLTVQTVDRAGNRSQEVNYSFYVVSDPASDAHGDLDGDGSADLIATGADGTLYTLLGNGDGTLRPAVTHADSPTTFGTGLIAQNGDGNGDGYQDLLWITPNHGLEEATNNGLGDFGRVVLVTRPDGSDWSETTQLVQPGAGDGTSWGGLMSVENGHLLLWPTNMAHIFGGPTDLGAGYADLTVLTPGDVTGDGVSDLLIRDDSTGGLRIAPRAADGTVLPESDWTTVGTGFTKAAYPMLTVAGDADGDGFPDMYGVTAQGTLNFIPGEADGRFGEAQPISGTGLDWSTITALA
ncbi:FG-GAP repeat domain-containing protein [Actinacidiphila yeochonensis]|uniref:FG-GAP repeat domain-containing protein n=1 Tax=Actinacidiphila yeochonensis TaxID=89050 RepID=UPI000561FB6B|nr:VCBS repeat-containing protein [Actinacidiphila yeochonensis]